MLTRPGNPKAAANVGQNDFHRNALKCVDEFTSLGNTVDSVKIHSIKNKEPCGRFGLPVLKI